MRGRTATPPCSALPFAAVFVLRRKVPLPTPCQIWPRVRFPMPAFLRFRRILRNLTEAVEMVPNLAPSPSRTKRQTDPVPNLAQGQSAVGMPDRIRTCDLVSRSHTRYPAAPRAHIHFSAHLGLEPISKFSGQIVVNGGRSRLPRFPLCQTTGGFAGLSQPGASETSESDTLSS